ncbi:MULTISPECIES: hypothetical protein [Ochrobactrum]|uniref:Uncharacterized protein n=1 Tax=Ochrobactrum quorumnocens TaxID=271865 RepID=A0A5N1JY54_9HYPH|nr:MULTISPECIES: hypothetical protein [Brucella/Ochrobactrum group]KAA9368270.1 hypothetical protein F3W84_10285 [[Ochrobactrum] quorumnocens]MBD7991831.1 hypothetical protein [Ochrobactrum gallinarum]
MHLPADCFGGIGEVPVQDIKHQDLYSLLRPNAGCIFIVASVANNAGRSARAQALSSSQEKAQKDSLIETLPDRHAFEDDVYVPDKPMQRNPAIIGALFMCF